MLGAEGRSTVNITSTPDQPTHHRSHRVSCPQGQRTLATVILEQPQTAMFSESNFPTSSNRVHQSLQNWIKLALVCRSAGGTFATRFTRFLRWSSMSSESWWSIGMPTRSWPNVGSVIQSDILIAHRRTISASLDLLGTLKWRQHVTTPSHQKLTVSKCHKTLPVPTLPLASLATMQIWALRNGPSAPLCTSSV